VLLDIVGDKVGQVVESVVFVALGRAQGVVDNVAQGDHIAEAVIEEAFADAIQGVAVDAPVAVDMAADQQCAGSSWPRRRAGS